MPKSQNITDKLMNEVIIYGGLPVRRIDVHRDVMKNLNNRKAADMFAFGPNTKVVKAKPYSFNQLQKMGKSPKKKR